MESRSLFTGCILMLILLNFAACDVEKDREKCANSLVGLATCLPYVSGEAKAPPNDCCTGFKQVLKTSIDCICLLIKDRNDPSLGLKINATLALSLPARCQAPVNESITDCPSKLPYRTSFKYACTEELFFICHQIHRMLRCLRILQRVLIKATLLPLLLLLLLLIKGARHLHHQPLIKRAMQRKRRYGWRLKWLLEY